MNKINSILCVCLSSIVLTSCGGSDDFFDGMNTRDFGTDSSLQAPPPITQTTRDTLVDSQTPSASPHNTATKIINDIPEEEFRSVECISADVAGNRLTNVGHAILDMQLNNDSGSTAKLAPCRLMGVMMLARFFGQL